MYFFPPGVVKNKNKNGVLIVIIKIKTHIPLWDIQANFLPDVGSGFDYIRQN